MFEREELEYLAQAARIAGWAEGRCPCCGKPEGTCEQCLNGTCDHAETGAAWAWLPVVK